MLLAVDPGVKGSGYALFDCERLARAWYSDIVHLYGAAELAIERPQVYVGRRQKGDPNDLISVAIAAGVIAGVACCESRSVRWLLPSEWKGSTPKAIHQRRVGDALTADEACTLQKDLAKVPAALRHNVIDAVGIGLFALRRIDRNGSRL